MRVPHVLLAADEVRAAVRSLERRDSFVLDLETTMGTPISNRVRWVGLGSYAESYLIPVEHPKGIVLEREHAIKQARCLLYPPEDPRHWTPVTHKPSFTMEDVKLPTIYAEPPAQIPAGDVADIIRPLLFSGRSKVGSNIKFDIQSMFKYYDAMPPGPYHDTIVSRHILNEDLREYGLKPLTYSTFGWSVERRKSYPDLGRQDVANFGLDEVARYLNKDLRYAWLIHQRDIKILARKNLRHVYDFEMSLYPVLIDMEYEGFPIDLTEMEAVKAKLMDDIHAVEEKVWAEVGDKFPLSNTEAKRWVMFGRRALYAKSQWATKGKFKPIPVGTSNTVKLATQGLEPLSYTAKTADRLDPRERVPQITKAVLDVYANTFGNPMANYLLEWSGLEKLRGTFIEGMSGFLQPHTDGTQRVHTGFKQHGTKTGRLSAAEPNPQQLPREVPGKASIRSLYVAGKGYLLIVADYDQVELRCAAYESGDPAMLTVFQRGEDIHRSAAAAMFSVDLEDVTEEMRAVGKTQNFAVLYGAGPARIAFVARCSIQRAKQLIRRYYHTFAGLEPWKARLLDRARKAGDFADQGAKPPHVVIPPIGRLRRLPLLYANHDGTRMHAERQAVNARIQGFASNIAKMAMIELHPKLQQFPAPARMLMQVHDEVVIRVDERYVFEALPLVVETMSGVKNAQGKPILGPVPLIVSAKVGYTWASAKGAK